VQSRFYKEDTDAAETYIIVAIGRIVVVPIRNRAVVGIVVPATAQVSHG
jgi:primosomal protein N'